MRGIVVGFSGAFERSGVSGERIGASHRCDVSGCDGVAAECDGATDEDNGRPSRPSSVLRSVSTPLSEAVRRGVVVTTIPRGFSGLDGGGSFSTGDIDRGFGGLTPSDRGASGTGGGTGIDRAGAGGGRALARLGRGTSGGELVEGRLALLRSAVGFRMRRVSFVCRSIRTQESERLSSLNYDTQRMAGCLFWNRTTG
jgi:hypothetical protein